MSEWVPDVSNSDEITVFLLRFGVLEGDVMREDLEGELLFDDDENTVKISILFGISQFVGGTSAEFHQKVPVAPQWF